ncbi:YbaN family protein [Oligoflexus tunisiensis]|uniref:YbaN family protein n=1 Tax=Oligoflexus tunisiensis TaxID=708132 RepID=UPI000A946F91|nr:YbaN family protein [Oligoflexus tunisiensis]
MDQKKRDDVDYSHEVRLIQSRSGRYAMVSLAMLFLVLGFIGVFIPIMPTMPFVLLAAVCFARSSPRFYNWLMNHQWFGPSLRDWKTTGGIRRKVKILAITVLVISMTPTIVFIIPIMGVKILLAVIGLLVAAFIATRPDPDAVRNRTPEP